MSGYTLFDMSDLGIAGRTDITLDGLNDSPTFAIRFDPALPGMEVGIRMDVTGVGDGEHGLRLAGMLLHELGRKILAQADQYELTTTTTTEGNQP